MTLSQRNTVPVDKVHGVEFLFKEGIRKNINCIFLLHREYGTDSGLIVEIKHGTNHIPMDLICFMYTNHDIT